MAQSLLLSTTNILSNISKLIVRDRGTFLSADTKGITDPDCLVEAAEIFADTQENLVWKDIMNVKEDLGLNDVTDSSEVPHLSDCFKISQTKPKSSLSLSQKTHTIYVLLILCGCHKSCQRRLLAIIDLALKKCSSLSVDLVWVFLWCFLHGWISYVRYLSFEYILTQKDHEEETTFLLLNANKAQRPITVYLNTALEGLTSKSDDRHVQQVIQKVFKLTKLFVIRVAVFRLKLKNEISDDNNDCLYPKNTQKENFFFRHYYQNDSKRQSRISLSDATTDNILHPKNTLQGNSRAPSSGIQIDNVNIDDIRRNIDRENLEDLSNTETDKSINHEKIVKKTTSPDLRKPVESNKNETTSKVGISKQTPQIAVANVKEKPVTKKLSKSNSETKKLPSKITSQKDVGVGKETPANEKSSKSNSASTKKKTSPKDVAKVEETSASKKSSKLNTETKMASSKKISQKHAVTAKAKPEKKKSVVKRKNEKDAEVSKSRTSPRRKKHRSS